MGSGTEVSRRCVSVVSVQCAETAVLSVLLVYLYYSVQY